MCFGLKVHLFFLLYSVNNIDLSPERGWKVLDLRHQQIKPSIINTALFSGMSWCRRRSGSRLTYPLMSQCQSRKSSLHLQQPVDRPGQFPCDLCREQINKQERQHYRLLHPKPYQRPLCERLRLKLSEV